MWKEENSTKEINKSHEMTWKGKGGEMEFLSVGSNKQPQFSSRMTETRSLCLHSGLPWPNFSASREFPGISSAIYIQR